MEEYFIIFYYFFICLFIVVLMLSVSFLLVRRKMDSEKLSSYECGFNPYEDARSKFEISFFLMGLFFMIFDLEIAFLVPFSFIFLYNLTFMGLLTLFFFLYILMFAFYFEWQKKALEWE